MNSTTIKITFCSTYEFTQRQGMVSSFAVRKDKPVLWISLYRSFHCTCSCRCCRSYCNGVGVQFVLCSKFIMHNSVLVLHFWTHFSCNLFWVWKWWALPLRQLFLNFWILPVNWSLIWSVFYYLWNVFWFSFKPPLKVLAQYSGCY